MLLLAASCDAAYDPPCRLTDRQDHLVVGFTPELAPTGDGRVVAFGWSLEDDDDASTRLAEVGVLEADGTLVQRWSIPVPVPATEVLEIPSGTRFLWTGDGLAVLRQVSEELPSDADGVHRRVVVTFRSISTDGEATDLIELEPTACVDCTLTWGAVGLGGRVALVFQPQPLTDDVEEPLAPTRTHHLLVAADGTVLSGGQYPWPARLQPLDDLQVLPRGDGLAVATADGFQVLDADLAPVSGPFEPEVPAVRSALDVDGDTVHIAWTDAFVNVLVERFGPAPSPAERLSEGYVQAVRARGDQVATLFWAGPDLYFAARNDDKLGGDVPLPTERGSLAAPGALFVDRPTGFAAFVGSRDRVDRVELDCVP